jgi:prepilin peptidase CpaA
LQVLTLPLIATLLGASAWAIREDLLFHRIPNRLTGSLLCVGLALQFAFGGWSGLGNAALGALIGLGVLLPLHLLRAMGAGDVKLLAALGSLLGPHWTLVAGVFTLIGGAVLAIGYVMVGALRAAALPAGAPWQLRIYNARERAQQLRHERFPYALAIVFGTFASVAQRGDLQAVISYLSGADR